MTHTETLTIVAVFLNFGAFCFAAYQSYLARKSIDESRKTLQMEMLPEAYFLLGVPARLQFWLDDIQRTMDAIREAIKRRDEKFLKNIVNKARKSPEGLVHRGS